MKKVLSGWLKSVNKKIRPVNKLLYRGKRYHCPICDAHLRKLRPYGVDTPVLVDKKVVGGGFRKNAQCPVCLATDRARLLYLYLHHKTDVFKRELKLLHVAPEGHLSTILRQHDNIDYVTADLDSKKVMVKMDITQIDYPAHSFDAIVCNHVLEHIPDDTKAMGELYRILKPGGWAILQVPFSLTLKETFEDDTVVTPNQRAAIFGQNDHVRIYAMDYVDRLKASGFVVEQFNWWQHQADFGGLGNRSGLLDNETLFFATKPR